ncbi:MAG TPA: heavy metal-associated domain-containing protein [Longimicrobium sp.]|nr:heavy metal-associated domain-containing protein [Longimicrobium sp.]
MSTTTTRETITLAVSGMTCGNCKRHVEEALSGVPGVHAAEVDLAAGRATVAFDAGAPTTEQLVDAVRDAGYDAEVATVEAATVETGDPRRMTGCGCGCSTAKA